MVENKITTRFIYIKLIFYVLSNVMLKQCAIRKTIIVTFKKFCSLISV